EPGDVVAPGEQRRGRGRDRLVDALHRHLVQVGVVDPELLAIAHEDLLVGLVVGPAELAGALEGERARGALDHLAGAVVDLLVEARGGGLRGGIEGEEVVEAGCESGGRAEGTGREDEAHGGYLEGWMISRLPFDAMGVTSPAFSMSSIRRAARL